MSRTVLLLITLCAILLAGCTTTVTLKLEVDRPLAVTIDGSQGSP